MSGLGWYSPERVEARRTLALWDAAVALYRVSQAMVAADSLSVADHGAILDSCGLHRAEFAACERAGLADPATVAYGGAQ